MIKKHPHKTEEHLNRIYLVPSGRVGLKCIFDLLNLNKRNKILLPSYIDITDKEGSSIFDPIREKKIGFEFYRINKKIETTSLYYRIIEQIDRKKFPVSYYISNHILNLPIHQDITIKDIEYMAKGLKEVLGAERG